MPNWKFRRLSKSEMNRGGIESEFFAGGESSVSSLVRETIQNSLDAVHDKTAPVVVRYAFVRVPMPNKAWWTELHPHLAAAKLLPEPARASHFLVVEDFNTIGLGGDTKASRMSDLKGDRSDFYYFWRNVGITGKQGSQLGSWGLGKLVYPAASEAKAMLALTRRVTDNQELLMGFAGLSPHEDPKHPGTWNDAIGYYGEYSDPEDEYFALPIDDAEIIKEFRKDFGLARADEPGLSVVVPWPNDEYEEVDVHRALTFEVVRQFPIPILERRLKIDIIGEDGEVLNIDHDTVEFLASRKPNGVDPARHKRACQALQMAQSRASAPLYTVVYKQTPADNAAVTWERLEIPDLAEARRNFAANQVIGFEIPLQIRTKGSASVATKFRCWLQSCDATSSIISFVRQGLTISEVGTTPIGGAAAIVVIDDEPLASLLRAAENPAHTKWNAKAERVKARYIGADSRISFVTAAPKGLVAQLLNVENVIDRDLLADMFPDPTPEGVRTAAEAAKKGESRLPLNPPIGKPKPFRIAQIDGGFTIARNNGFDARFLEVTVAYDCEGKNPFTAYEQFDFELDKDPIMVVTFGGFVESIQSNKMRLNVGEGFRVKVTGFDPKRDLIVKFRSERGAEE